MASESVRRNTAVTMTAHLVEVFAPLLRDEEKRDAYIEVMAIVLAGLETVEIAEARQTRRWMAVELPSRN
jgi:hypothetical protein